MASERGALGSRGKIDGKLTFESQPGPKSEPAAGAGMLAHDTPEGCDGTATLIAGRERPPPSREGGVQGDCSFPQYLQLKARGRRKGKKQSDKNFTQKNQK